MKTETVKLTQIQVNGANPRIIKDEKFTKLVNSILVFPQMLELRPIVVNETFVSLGGNMRFRALTFIADMPINDLKARLTDIRDFQKKTPTEQDALIAYWERWQDSPTAPIIKASELSDEQQKEFIIKDNVGYGEWDYDMLANDWDNDDLQEWGLDVWNDEEDTKISEDDAPEIDNTVEPIIKLGDVWQLGSHRLLCGDSTNKESVLRLMGKTQADLYLSDPPYNVAYEGGTGLTMQNDSMSDIDFCTFLHKAFESVDAVLKDGGSFYIWHSESQGYNFREACKANNWRVRQCLIWNKNSMVMGRQDYQWKHEPCLYGWKDGASHTWYSDRKQTTVIDFDRPTRNGDHPTMKPVGLMGYLIKNSTKIGQVVLDTFGGSGSTLMACEQLDRICYIVELDPHYADVIVKRWEEQTEQKAVLLENITQ